MADYERIKEEMKELRDVQQEYKVVVERLQRAEVQVERLKRRGEDGSEMKKRVVWLEGENKRVREEMEAMMVEYERVVARGGVDVTREETRETRVEVGKEINKEETEKWKRRYEEEEVKARIAEARVHRLEMEREGREGEVGELRERVRVMEGELRVVDDMNKENKGEDKEGEMGKRLVQLQEQNRVLRQALEQAKEVGSSNTLIKETKASRECSGWID